MSYIYIYKRKNSIYLYWIQLYRAGIELANDKLIAYYQKVSRSVCCIFICILNFKRGKSSKLYVCIYFDLF